MHTTTPNWCAVLSCGVDQGKSRDAQCLGTCTPPGSRKLPQQRKSDGESFAQSLKEVINLFSFTPRYVGTGQVNDEVRTG